MSDIEWPAPADDPDEEPVEDWAADPDDDEGGETD
jgi:hypothetical protein